MASESAPPMKITSAEFLTSAPDLASCPDEAVEEFAFIGRSNVGKSSLLNMLTGRKDLAKVSGNPGHTRLLNFFTINDRWRLVDLPGYGYAKTSKKNRDKLEVMITDYLAGRPNLLCTFVLIDARHEPQQNDLDFVRWMMEGGFPFVLVFTKADKLKASRVARNMEAFGVAMSEWCEGLPRMFTSSVLKAEGKREILGFIGQALG